MSASTSLEVVAEGTSAARVVEAVARGVFVSLSAAQVKSEGLGTAKPDAAPRYLELPHRIPYLSYRFMNVLAP